MGRANKFREEDFKYKPTPEKFRKEGESTHGQGRHHAHKAGETVSYRTPRGRDSGTIIEAHKEYYEVRNGNDVVRVNRNSILYSLGTFIGGARQTIENVKKSYEFGKEKEDERLIKFKAQYGKKKPHKYVPPKKKLTLKKKVK